MAAAGAFSAVPATLVAAPAERIKILLQVRPSNGHILVLADKVSLRYKDKVDRLLILVWRM